MTMDETLQGQRYVLRGPLGEGSQGRTYEAFDRRDGRMVAIKRFDVRGARTWKGAELAEREARVLQSLSHPKLPRYIDHFEESGALYLVMEKIEGETLATLRTRGVILAPETVFRFLEDASSVLDYLHRRPVPVVHRDLKPGNVIRRPDGSFAFVDFGAVRDKLRPEGGSTVVGTFGYMAPEQFQGRALPASDVYAVGATALALLTGCEPENLPHRGLAIDVRAATGGRIDPAFVHVLERMLDPDPDRRASRLSPLLEGLRGRGTGRWRVAPDPRVTFALLSAAIIRETVRWSVAPDPSVDSYGLGASRSARRERHAARKAARRERRAAHRAARMRFHGRPPRPIAWLLAMGLTVAIVAVFVVTRIAVPLLLFTLSRLFARRGLTRATAAVQGAGKVALSHLVTTRRRLIHGEIYGENEDEAGFETVEHDGLHGPRVRVVAGPSPVSAAEADDEAGETDHHDRSASNAPGAKR
jgi:hypothetical protein